MTADTDESNPLAALLEQLRAKFLARFPGLAADIARALAESDLAGAARMAHTLRGTGGTLRVAGLVELTLALEAACEAGDATAATEAGDELVALAARGD